MEFKLITYFDESYIDSIYETYQSVGWLNMTKRLYVRFSIIVHM